MISAMPRQLHAITFHARAIPRRRHQQFGVLGRVDGVSHVRQRRAPAAVTGSSRWLSAVAHVRIWSSGSIPFCLLRVAPSAVEDAAALRGRLLRRGVANPRPRDGQGSESGGDVVGAVASCVWRCMHGGCMHGGGCVRVGCMRRRVQSRRDRVRRREGRRVWCRRRIRR